MKRPRQFLQLVGTGLLLAAVLLALELTAPPQADPVIRSLEKIPAAIVPRLDSGRDIVVARHEDAATPRVDSAGMPDARTSFGSSGPTLLANGISHGPPSPDGDPAVSFRDPIISRFHELETFEVQQVDPQLAGHSLTAFGRRAAVEESGQVSGTTGVLLTLSVDPVSPTPEDQPSPTSSQPTAAADAGTTPDAEAVVKPHAVGSWSGLTYEQELFRTKWGWHAFDQVQKVLREQQGP